MRVLALAFAAAGCARIHTTAPTMLGEVRDNEIAALELYQGKTVEVGGIVDSTGLRNYQQTTIEPSFWGIYAGAEVNSTTKQRAFVTLSGVREDGDVVCFFDDDNRKAAAGLSKGDPVVLSGTVVRLKRVHNMSIAFLEGCDVISPKR